MNNNNQQNNQDQSQQTQPVSIGVDKEQEIAKPLDMPIEEAVEYEIPKEIKKHVAKIKDEIELPPDLKKIGVAVPSCNASVSDVAKTSLNLPLTDDEIEKGLHAQIFKSIRWLAEWCLYKLKKANIH